jgi:hypothetical protein
MKNAIKRGVSGVLLALGLVSLTGCFSYHHDSDYVYRNPSSTSYDRDWHDRYSYSGPRHPDWNYD